MSPFDNLAKILVQEQSKGCTNGLVIGGLEAFVENWAHKSTSSEDPAQNELISQLLASMQGYDGAKIEARREMLGRAIALIKPALSPERHPHTRSERKAVNPASSHRVAAPPPHIPAATAKEPVTPAQPQPSPVDEDGDEQEAESPRVISAREAGFGLDAPVTRMQGVGPQRAKLLGKLGIGKVRDLLYLFPRRYVDYSQLKTISQLMYGDEATVLAKVGTVKTSHVRGRFIITNAVFFDSSGNINATFYNQPFLDKQLKPDMKVVLHGKVARDMNRLCFKHPEWEAFTKDSVGIQPVYPLTEGLSEYWLRRLMRAVVKYWADKVVDPLSSVLRKRADVIDLATALREIHFPTSWEHVKPARRRLALEELLIHQMGIQQQRQQWQAEAGWQFRVEQDYRSAVLPAILPFTLTPSQERVIDEILADMQKPEPMHRLLQGDVGSGKTVVALSAMLCAVLNRTQAAMMAPTEILADQHYQSIERILASDRFKQAALDRGWQAPPRLGLLVGSLTPSKKDKMQRAIGDGAVDIIIGTHALIQDAVHFKSLGLIVIDEQHRFGVNQRRVMQNKTDHPDISPDLLVMSATPIPQTLALTVFGDLDVSIIDGMPPGRQAIRTKWLEPRERERAYAFIHKQVKEGRQAFVICPLVEESEAIDAKAAVEEYERLRREVYPDLRVGLIHGKLKGAEKDTVMSDFAAGKIDVLVATSVIEVGIDVPNATVMLIEGADRFGLAQLHQFRGRIGRGQHQSFCMLLAEESGSTSDDRLRIIEETQNGFILAEADLQLRGPGEIRNRVGERQSGVIDFKIATLQDIPLLQEAQQIARELLEADPGLVKPENQLLKEKVHDFWKEDE